MEGRLLVARAAAVTVVEAEVVKEAEARAVVMVEAGTVAVGLVVAGEGCS